MVEENNYESGFSLLSNLQIKSDKNKKDNEFSVFDKHINSKKIQYIYFTNET